MSEFIVITEGSPIPKGRPRFARIGGYVKTYKVKGEQEAEDIFKEEAKRQLFYQGLTSPIAKPNAVEVSCQFSYSFPKSYSQKKCEWLLGSDRILRPDLDNLIKFYIDGLNGIAFEDDCQVVSYTNCRKFWGGDDLTKIVIKILESGCAS